MGSGRQAGAGDRGAGKNGTHRPDRLYAGLPYPPGKGREVLWLEAGGTAAAPQKEKGWPSAQTGGYRPPGPPYRRSEGQNVPQEKSRLCQAAGEEEMKTARPALESAGRASFFVAKQDDPQGNSTGRSPA